jgi:hypothetical protein
VVAADDATAESIATALAAHAPQPAACPGQLAVPARRQAAAGGDVDPEGDAAVCLDCRSTREQWEPDPEAGHLSYD